jgi:N-acetyl-anhydromuramyl-L-alanine amidase AmpD
MLSINNELILPKKYYDSEMEPKGIIWHGMSAKNAHELFPASHPADDPFDVGVNIAILKHYSYSAHAIIDRKGNVFQLVPWNRRARHAGISLFNGEPDCNRWTIGVEFLTLFKTTKQYGPAYTQEQIKAGLALRDYLIEWFKFPMANQAGHDEVRHAAVVAGLTDKNGDPPKSKPDPGKEFPWELFRPSMKPLGLDESQKEILSGRSEKMAQKLAQADGS